MEETNKKYYVFIDYDNLAKEQKSAGMLDVVTRALIQTPIERYHPRASCDVRIYGGWYEGTAISRLAEQITIEIQNDFPKIIRLPATNGHGGISIATNAELAVSMLQEPGHHLFNTYRKKGKPSNIRVSDPFSVGCQRDDCILPKAKKLLASGKCPTQGCTASSAELVYRHEQKIVDTMLSCDLIHAANSDGGVIILISGDDDFLPPLRAVTLKGVDAIRFHPKLSSHRAAFPQGGARLLELEL